MPAIEHNTPIAVIGAGSIGIAVAYYLVTRHGATMVTLVDPLPPMSLTSAQSGENYRNWWPHPGMRAFTDHSIDLMEAIDAESGGRLNMTRGGYAVVTRRENPEKLLEDLRRGYAGSGAEIRMRGRGESSGYQPPLRAPWRSAPGGVDVLCDRDLIRATFPSFAPDVATVIHIRRAGSIDAQQLGQYMLERIRAAGGKLVRARVHDISGRAPFTLDLEAEGGSSRLQAEIVVNAAGPYLSDVAAMLGEDLALKCVYQQKIAIEDREAAIPRNMPFTIDMDEQTLAWGDEDAKLLAADPGTRRLVEPMQGGVHCRPYGTVDGNWIKLGWAYNDTANDPHGEDPLDPQFPDTVLRGASRLHPRLAAYIGRLPRGARHYGGYYTKTPENWPLLGPMGTPGAFVAGAMSGYGSMAACAAGELCAAWIFDAPVPEFAQSLSPRRLADARLRAEIARGGGGSL